jgi:hypothetical protein
MPLSATNSAAGSVIAGSRTEPIVERQFAVGIEFGRPSLSTSFALEDKVPFVDDCDTETIQLGASHVADVFFISSVTIQESHDVNILSRRGKSTQVYLALPIAAVKAS